MPSAVDADEARVEFERKASGLVGLELLGLTYWDIHNFSDADRVWDYGDWHHAVMGVELATDAGPRTLIWTDTFFPYGVEVFNDPIDQHLTLGPEGPEGWDVGAHPLWQARLGQPVVAVDIFWEHIEVGAGKSWDGTIVSPPESFDVPVGLRLDFAGGPVWFVAGMPQWPNVDDVFVPGDEIMVVFSAERMLRIGFPAGGFTAT